MFWNLHRDQPTFLPPWSLYVASLLDTLNSELSFLSPSGGSPWVAVKICDSCLLNLASEQFWLHSSWVCCFFPLVEEKLVVKP